MCTLLDIQILIIIYKIIVAVLLEETLKKQYLNNNKYKII